MANCDAQRARGIERPDQKLGGSEYRWEGTMQLGKNTGRIAYGEGESEREKVSEGWHREPWGLERGGAAKKNKGTKWGKA